MVPVAIAIFDENPILLDALRALCTAIGFDVVATGRSAGEAVKLAASQRIDIFVLDPTMQGGMDTVSAVLSQSPDTKVVAYSPAIGADYAVRAIEAGARGYVLKKCGADELITAIRSVIDGETFITPSFATTILTALRDDRLRKRAAQLVDFSIRENQIMRLLLRGRTNKEIAKTLAISEKTVKCYMTTVMQKLNARNRTEAVLACQKIGLQQDIELSAHCRIGLFKNFFLPDGRTQNLLEQRTALYPIIALVGQIKCRIIFYDTHARPLLTQPAWNADRAFLALPRAANDRTISKREIVIADKGLGTALADI